MIVRSPFKTLVNSILLTAALAVSAAAPAVDILLQSTTSTANSGLYEAILPAFTAQTGITVHVVSVGTGQAFKNAKNGDGDVLLVHAKSAEEDFVQAGYGVERFDVMSSVPAARIPGVNLLGNTLVNLGVLWYGLQDRL